MLKQGSKSSLLTYIKHYKNYFIYTIEARRDTSTGNKDLHELMLGAITTQQWDLVSVLLQSEDYAKPLEGVIFTLHRYTGISYELFSEIVEAYEEGRIV